MASFFYWIFRFAQRQKWLSLSLLLALVVGLGFSVSNLNFEENIRDVLPQDERLNEVTTIIENLGLSNRLVVLVSDTTGNNPDSLIATAEALADSLTANYSDLVGEITLKIPNQKLDQLHGVYAANLPFYLEQSDYAVLANRIQPDSIAYSVQKLLRILSSPMGMVGNKFLIEDPLNIVSTALLRAKDLQLDQEIQLYKNHLLSADKKHMLFFIDMANPGSETELNGQLIDGIDKWIGSHKKLSPQQEVVYFGSPAMAVANARQIKRDIQYTVTIALIFLFCFISFYYRKIQTFILVILPGAFGALVALSILALVRDSVSIISLGIGSVLLGITIDYALHMMTHVKHNTDMRKVFLEISFPTILCSLTSAVAFLSLFFIESNALQDLGIFAAVSIFSAALFTTLVFPHLLIKRKNTTAAAKENVVERTVNYLAAFPYHQKKWVLASVALVTVVCGFTWQHYGFEDDMLQLNFAPAHLVQAEKDIQAVSQVADKNMYLAATDSNITAALSKNKALSDSLDLWMSQGIINGYLNLNRLVPDGDKQQRKLADWNAFWQSHSKSEFVENLTEAGVEIGFEPDAFSQFSEIVSKDYTAVSDADIRTLVDVFGEDFLVDNDNGDVTLISLVNVEPANRDSLAGRLDQIAGAERIDRQSIAKQLVVLLEKDFNKLVRFSLIAVFLLLLIAYGRIEQALLVFVPILLSWLWVLGIMGLFGLKFNIVNVIVCSFIFGIGVDYSIFVAHGLFQPKGSGLSQFQTTKRAIILSAITTLVGIGALIFAKHPAIQSIALLTIIGISATLLITFTVQPLIFNLFVGNRKKKGLIPFTLFSFCVSVFAFTYFLLGCILLSLLRWLFYIPFAPKKTRKYIFHFVMSKFCGSLIYIMMNVGKTILDRDKADFSKPAVIIANHHSFLDILLMLMLHPKIVIVTNSWVYNSPFFGKTVQYADFIHAAEGVENQFDSIQEKVNDGYSIVVFPEGSRSPSQKLRRFHKGAFFLAEQLKLDIQPILIHGTSFTMPKGDDFYLKSTRMTLKFLDRIKADDLSYGETYKERTKSISAEFKAAHKALREELETPRYFREIMMKNYLYRGPILEWYFKVKTSMEGNYELFHTLVPRKAKVYDLGCGYGFMSYALAYSSSEREIFGYDYDGEKIEVGNDCAAKPLNVGFAQGDVVTCPLEEADVFILSDVLHYLQPAEQEIVMHRMFRNLRPNGRIIVRDSDSSNRARHEGSKLTEFFSTNFGFNKTRNKLNFVSREFFEKFARENRLNLEVIDNTKLTSNLIFILSEK